MFSVQNPHRFTIANQVTVPKLQQYSSATGTGDLLPAAVYCEKGQSFLAMGATEEYRGNQWDSLEQARTFSNPTTTNS